MEIWLDKKDCTGCSACANVCPKNAISMVSDECGFKYPKIDHDKCINCGLCKRICPIVNKFNEDKKMIPIVYAGWSKNESIRYSSTTGGMFTELTMPIIEKGGYVVGASYNKENLVEHKMVNTLEGLNELKQSKYLQSDIKNVYKETKEKLESGKIVAFCGAPCQIAGLYNFLQKKYDNLLTIEFICRGMNSPKAYKSWLSEIENLEKKKIKNVWFKYKINGWKKSPKCTRVDFNDNSYKVYSAEDNLYMRGYLENNLYIRPSCGNCRFNGLPRQADITLADFWGVSKELDNDKGTSLILINSDNGMQYFINIKDRIFCKEKQIEDIYKGNVCFNNSVKINKKSKKFLTELNENNFSLLINKYSKVSFLKKIYDKIKKYNLVCRYYEKKK